MASGQSLRRARRLIATSIAASLALAVAGCDEDAVSREFRDAATSSISEGLKSILTGVVDGLVAVTETGTNVSADEQADNNTGGASDTTGGGG